jgi:excisionase family DNA binding protein
LPDYNARIELDSRDFDESAVAVLMDEIAEYDGVVSRAVHGGRVELIITVPAKTFRQAVMGAMALVLSIGHDIHAIEVLPTDDFHSRIDAVRMPELLSITQAAERLKVSRQRALQLANGGKLGAVKVGDTWVVPATAVTSRDDRTGVHWSGLVVPVGVESDQHQVIDPDAIDVDRQPLPVFDGRGDLIGLARTVRREEGGWTAAGALRGLAPGNYGVIPDLDLLHVRDEGMVRHITRALLRGLTVVGAGDRTSVFPEAQVYVSDQRAYMDLTLVRQVQEVLSYP